eukprot:TRINITY_DN17547_c0_g1_i1.p1 TRINITY_DN17547_c0_g1~~TRINITY_DN17547_c0_g1_i1.p1  ORF type:complete len:438 (+),score=115.86 TRINITY_DN17547_c0_g1_i1:92-1315(+)
MDAGKIFSRTDEDGSCPLVLVPTERWPCSLYIRVPEDAQVVMQKWGADIDPLAPGFHWKMPWYRIAYLVTKQANTYNVPVLGCPTIDNVKVKVNLSLLFHINSARDFVYKLGAMRFDELLQAAAEEAVRCLVREQTMDKIYELRGARADEMLDDINDKFKEFGVHFSNATITEVELPGKLCKSLEKATTYDSRILHEVESHQFNMIEADNTAQRERRETEITNEMAFRELVAEKERALVDQEQKTLEASRKKDVDLLKAKEASEVMKIRAEGDRENSATRAEREVIEKKQKAESDASKKKHAADRESTVLRIQSDAQLRLTTDTSQTKLAEAEAEAQAVLMLEAKRSHDLELKRIQVLQEMGHGGRIYVSGQDAEKMIGSILESAIQPTPQKASQILLVAFPCWCED